MKIITFHQIFNKTPFQRVMEKEMSHNVPRDVLGIFCSYIFGIILLPFDWRIGLGFFVGTMCIHYGYYVLKGQVGILVPILVPIVLYKQWTQRIKLIKGLCFTQSWSFCWESFGYFDYLLHHISRLK